MFFPDVNDFLEEEKNWGGKKRVKLSKKKKKKVRGKNKRKQKNVDSREIC